MTFLLLITGALIRMIGITRPLLGNFATKGVAYAMIAKNFISNPNTIFYPTLDVLINGKPALHMMEWPFFAYLVGILHRFVPWIGIDATGRAVSIIFFIFSAWFFYLLFCQMFGSELANYALMFFMFFPLGIIYGQSFQLEAFMMFCITATFYYICLWLKGDKSLWRAVLIWLLISVLLLMKIQMLCLGLPVLVLFLSSKHGRLLLCKPFTYVFAGACFVLPVMWYLHTISVAQTYDNVTFSILYSVKIRTFPDPRIFSPEFYLRIIKTLSKETFSPVGLVLSITGVFAIYKIKQPTKYFVYAYSVAMAFYFLLMPRKVYEMNYYFMPLLIPGAILSAFGLSMVRTRTIRYFIVTFFLTISFAVAYNPSFKTSDSEKGFICIARKLNSYIPKNSLIVVSSKGAAIAFLYYTGHKGWILNITAPEIQPREKKAREELGMETETDPIKLLEKYISEGAEFFVCDSVVYLKRSNKSFYNYLLHNFQPVYEEDFFIVNLSSRRY